MSNKRIVVILLAAVMVSSGFAVAAERGQAAKPAPGMAETPMGRGMMGADGMMPGAGMMGMMNMMGQCERMMRAGMSGNAMIPRLPPGNEKLEFQMHAEMMQKMGEIATRYAERIKEAK